MSPVPTFAPSSDLSTIPLSSSPLIVLPTGGYGCGRALAINSTGVEGGHVFTCASPGLVQAALWVNGALVVLPSLASTGSSNVIAVASDSTAAGFAIDALGVAHATSWRNGVLTVLPGGESSTAVSISPDGVIAGSVVLAGVRLPALWVNGLLVTDAQPAGYVGARFNSRAVAVVAGTALNPVNGIVRGARAFRWLGPGSYQLLDLPATASSVALGQVNNAGTVVGMVFGAGGASSVYWPAALTTPVMVPMPLEAASGDLRTINNSGVLAGSLTSVGLNAQTVPVFYPTTTGIWSRLITGDAFGAVYGSNDLGAFAGSIGNPNAQPVMWAAVP
ncbi:MAG: hypothetical protein M3068_00215 [Gemmatimonadota bacterium]|nr:hypothetical protein [Gemmatimonadota bacterium]